MPQSKQTPRVWSDAVRGSEILANWTKLGISAVFLWLSIGVVLGIAVGGWWFLHGTISLERRLRVHHIRNGIGIGGRIQIVASCLFSCSCRCIYRLLLTLLDLPRANLLEYFSRGRRRPTKSSSRSRATC